jgi:hypothetical protein
MGLNHVLVLVVVLSLLPKCAMPQTQRTSDTRSKVSGVWSSATLDQVGAVQRPECTFLTVTERKVTLKQVAGSDRFEGEWVRWTRNVWMRSDNLSCRWYPGEEQFEPVLGAIWTYAVKDITPDDQRDSLRVQGSYVGCLSNGCNKMQVQDKDKMFHTQLKLLGGSLIDTNETDDPMDDVAFIRLSDEADLVDDARTAVETFLKTLDQGQIDRFYTTSTSSAFRTNISPGQFHSAMTDLQTNSGLVNTRRYQLTTNILYAPMINKARGEYVLFSNIIASTQNKSGVEFVLLIREQSEWRVCWLNYGS